MDKKDFYDLLNNTEQDGDEDEDENEICLITREKLENNFIKLDCGHSFNYLPLYKELKEQKTKKILDNAKLKINEIKCPYCRIKSQLILPSFNKYYETKSVIGVNFPKKSCYILNNCEHYNKKTKTFCNDSACITNYGIFCNKHVKCSYIEEEKLKNISIEKNNEYKDKKVKELREILKNNKCKISGTKNELIERILLNIVCNE